MDAVGVPQLLARVRVDPDNAVLDTDDQLRLMKQLIEAEGVDGEEVARRILEQVRVP